MLLLRSSGVYQTHISAGLVFGEQVSAASTTWVVPIIEPVGIKGQLAASRATPVVVLDLNVVVCVSGKLGGRVCQYSDLLIIITVVLELIPSARQT